MSNISPLPPEPFRRANKSIVVVASVVLVAAVALLVWAVADVLVLVFAGILLAVFLRALSDTLSRWTGLPDGWSLAVTLVLLATVLALAGWQLGAEVVNQLDELVPRVQKIWAEQQEHLRHYEWGRSLLANTDVEAMARGHTEWLARLTGGVFSSALGTLAGLLIIFFIGLYVAAAPRIYVAGLLRLVPRRGRERAAEVLATLGRTLRWWLIGTFVRMALVGIATTSGLLLLGMPLALALGLIAFVFDFVPYLGAILAATPGLLVALAVGPTEAAYVALLYLGIHAAENYLVAPLVDQRSVNLPPALAVSIQLLLGSTYLGLLGVMFATPLTAVGIVLVRMLYIESYLGENAPARERGGG